MKSPVKLYLRVRLPDGTYPYLKPAYASNGRIRPRHAIRDGGVIHCPGSTYYLGCVIGVNELGSHRMFSNREACAGIVGNQTLFRAHLF